MGEHCPLEVLQAHGEGVEGVDGGDDVVASGIEDEVSEAAALAIEGQGAPDAGRRRPSSLSVPAVGQPSSSARPRTAE